MPDDKEIRPLDGALVLVVVDSPIQALEIEQILTDGGAQVVICTTAADAAQQLALKHFSLIIIDLDARPHQIDFIALAHKLERNNAKRLLLSSIHPEALGLDGLSGPMLLKPFERKMLPSYIARYLGNGRLE